MSDGKAESQAACVRWAGGRTVEGLEDPLLFISRYAGPTVRDDELEPIAFTPHREFDWRAGRRVLERVLQEIYEDAECVNKIESAKDQRFSGVQRDVQLMAIECSGNPLKSCPDEIVRGLDLGRNSERTTGEARQVEKVRDEAVEPTSLLLDRERAIITLSSDIVRERCDRGERRPKIV